MQIMSKLLVFFQMEQQISFDTTAEKVFGKPVVFTDAAVKPIVGDFNYFGINYDGTTYDTDKDVKKANICLY